MARCPHCSTDQQNGRFCTQCGARMPDAADPADPYASAPTVHEQSLADSLLQPSGPETPPPTREYQSYVPPVGPHSPPPWQPPYPAPERRGSARRGWLIAGAAFLVVAALATTTVLVLQRTGDSGSATTTTATGAPQTAGPPASARPSVSAESKAVAPGRSVGGTSTTASAVSTTTTAAGAGSVASSSAGAPASVLPLGGPRVDIPCADGGYIVQVASELDPATFEQRVTGLRAAGQLPPDAKWAEANASCAIFTSQVNVLVLYAGPFTSPYDACPARLASPPDAFIKGTTQASANAFVSCLCPATVGELPAISDVGQQGVWVGELQRVLGTALDLDVGSINADSATGSPGSWGVYTAGTAAAVGAFQAANGLPVTDQVDAATWSALQTKIC